MQKTVSKKKKQSKKTEPIPVVELDNVSTPINEKTQLEVLPKIEKKSILKPLLFFAVFFLLIEAAVLYPYLTEPVYSLKMVASEPALTAAVEVPKEDVLPPSNIEVQPSQNTQEQKECVQKECDCPKIQDENRDSQVNALKAVIHDLEIENLTLKERVNMATDTTPALIELMRNVYIGQPFKKQLSQILKQDKMNTFALEIQKQLGDYALNGIPTDEQIESMFDSRFKVALDSFYVTRRDLTYWQQVKAFTKSLVRIYPKNLNPNNAEGVAWLYLAQKQVDDNDFTGAIESIKKLPPQSATLFYDFVKAANQRILANKIISAYFQRKEK